VSEDEIEIRQKIVNNLSDLINRRIKARASGKRIQADDIIAQIALGIAKGVY